jgi:hypothetical protein
MPPLPEPQTESEHSRMKRLLLTTALALTVGWAAVQVTTDAEWDSERNSDLPSAAEAQRCMSHFAALDRNSDSVLTGNELDHLKREVKGVDKNNDGKIRSTGYQVACATGVLKDSDIKS